MSLSCGSLKWDSTRSQKSAWGVPASPGCGRPVPAAATPLLLAAPAGVGATAGDAALAADMAGVAAARLTAEAAAAGVAALAALYCIFAQRTKIASLVSVSLSLAVMVRKQRWDTGGLSGLYLAAGWLAPRRLLAAPAFFLFCCA